MNGAELPCGSVIHVEAADCDANKKAKDESKRSISKEATSAPTSDIAADHCSPKDEVGTEDLDDFFDSL
jgi:hypothetical protein